MKFFVSNVSGYTNNRKNTEMYQRLVAYLNHIIKGDVCVFIDSIKNDIEMLNRKYPRQKDIDLDVLKTDDSIIINVVYSQRKDDSHVSFMCLQKVKNEIEFK